MAYDLNVHEWADRSLLAVLKVMVEGNGFGHQDRDIAAIEDEILKRMGAQK